MFSMDFVVSTVHIPAIHLTVTNPPFLPLNRPHGQFMSLLHTISVTFMLVQRAVRASLRKMSPNWRQDQGILLRRSVPRMAVFGDSVHVIVMVHPALTPHVRQEIHVEIALKCRLHVRINRLRNGAFFQFATVIIVRICNHN
jgi:hypothetical protein